MAAVAADAADETADAGPVEHQGLPTEPWRTTHDFIVTSMVFHVPEGLEAGDARVENPCGIEGFSDNSTYTPLALDGLVVDGWDLDGDEGVGDGVCPEADFVSPSGQAGIDFGFLHVMDQIRPARPGQTIEVVLASAPLQGLVNIGIRLIGVDDLANDDAVEVLVTTTREPPLVGADGTVLSGSSVSARSNPEHQSRFPGRIVEGVLHAGPADIAIGNINLLVVEDRVVSLKDARVRATVSARPDGGYDVEAIIGGWWMVDDMVEAIGEAILSIGSNPGELACVLERYADHSTDGVHCDAMSTMLQMKGVSGFITGLDADAGGSE